MKSKQAKQSKAKQSKYCRDVRTANKPASQPAAHTTRSLCFSFFSLFFLWQADFFFFFFSFWLASII
jgi:hypothetical protein